MPDSVSPSSCLGGSRDLRDAPNNTATPNQRENTMVKFTIRAIMLTLATFTLSFGDIGNFAGSAEASSTVSAQRSRQCSAEARRYADRNTRRTTAAGAAGGAAIGAIASGSRRNTGRNAGRGALIGGGAGLLASTSRWEVYYNYSYRNCVRR